MRDQNHKPEVPQPAHADQTELLARHQLTGKPATIFLVHGEEDSMQAFAKKLKGTRLEMPTLWQEHTL